MAGRGYSPVAGSAHGPAPPDGRVIAVERERDGAHVARLPELVFQQPVELTGAQFRTIDRGQGVSQGEDERTEIDGTAADPVLGGRDYSGAPARLPPGRSPP